MILTLCHKSPPWVKQATDEYLKRFGRDINLKIEELVPPARTKNSHIPGLIEEEAKLLENKIPKGSYVIVLDIHGAQPSTEDLSKNLEQWMQMGMPICLIIGGADGLSPSILKRANYKISLSKLTFPHPLVRVILVEQLYRSYSLLHGHPYHRA